MRNMYRSCCVECSKIVIHLVGDSLSGDCKVLDAVGDLNCGRLGGLKKGLLVFLLLRVLLGDRRFAVRAAIQGAVRAICLRVISGSSETAFDFLLHTVDLQPVEKREDATCDMEVIVDNIDEA